MYTSLSSRGYSILKSEHADDVLNKIKKELTVVPYISPDFAMNKPQPFKLYFESQSKLYIPKFYGISKFGPPSINKLLDFQTISVPFHGQLREEQIKPANMLLNACLNPSKKGGILNLFCGGGKTTISLYIVSLLKTKTLIIVHKDFLLNQWKERISEFLPTANVGLIKAKTIDVNGKDIVLASLKSLSMKEYDNEIFKGFGLSIFDEVHHTSAEVFSQALKKITFEYSIGLSATVKRKDGLSKVFMWFLGTIEYKSCKRKDTVKVICKNYYDPNPLYSKEYMIHGNKLNIAKMIGCICEYFPRTEFLTSILQQVLIQEPLRKVLVLSDRRNHLKTLYEYFTQLKIDCGMYVGGMNQKDLVESEKKQVILATFAIASEGYDQKGLDTLILASPKTDITQSVGRILRDKEQDRQHVPLIIDIIDNFSIFQRQAEKRVKWYRSNAYEVDYEERVSKVQLFGECLL